MIRNKWLFFVVAAACFPPWLPILTHFDFSPPVRAAGLGVQIIGFVALIALRKKIF